MPWGSLLLREQGRADNASRYRAEGPGDIFQQPAAEANAAKHQATRNRSKAALLWSSLLTAPTLPRWPGGMASLLFGLFTTVVCSTHSPNAQKRGNMLWYCVIQYLWKLRESWIALKTGRLALTGINQTSRSEGLSSAPNHSGITVCSEIWRNHTWA